MPLTALTLPAAQLRVLTVYAAFAGRDGVVTDVGRARLVSITGLNERTVRRAQDGLAAAGWLTATPGDGGRYSFVVLHRHPLRRGPDTPPARTPGPPRGGAETPPHLEVLEEEIPPGGSAPARPDPDPATQGDPMPSTPDPDQLGMFDDLEPTPAPTKKKPAADGGPAGRVVAAYCRSYVEEHERQPASERGRVAGQVKALLGQGHTEEELVEAAEELGRTRFTYLAEQVRLIRSRRPAGIPEGWGPVEAPAPTVSGPGQRIYG